MAWEFDRRALLGTVGVGAVAWVAMGPSPGEASASFAVAHTPAEWRKLLGPQRYRVLREAGTEPPFSSPLNKEHHRMRAFLVACGVALVVALCAVVVLNRIQKPAEVAFSTSAVRI